MNSILTVFHFGVCKLKEPIIYFLAYSLIYSWYLETFSGRKRKFDRCNESIRLPNGSKKRKLPDESCLMNYFMVPMKTRAVSKDCQYIWNKNCSSGNIRTIFLDENCEKIFYISQEVKRWKTPTFRRNSWNFFQFPFWERITETPKKKWEKLWISLTEERLTYTLDNT